MADDTKIVTYEAVGFGKNGAQGWLEKASEAFSQAFSEASEAQSVVDAVKAFEVKGQSDLSLVADWASEVKAKLKRLSALEREVLAVPSNVLTRIRDVFRPAKQAWSDAEHLLRAHLESAALRAKESNARAESEIRSALACGLDPSRAVNTMLHTSDLSNVRLKLKWVATVRDVSKLPDEYVVRLPNERKLKEYCSNVPEGQEPAPIAGVEFERAVDSRISAAKAKT